MMQARAIREGAVGLLITGGVLSFAGLFLWIYNLRPGSETYSFKIRYDTVSGLAPGANVRLRGVNLGRVEQVLPGADAVEVNVVINSLTPVPSQSNFVTSQTGLVGETVLEIMPFPKAVIGSNAGTPKGSDCDQAQIVCHGSVVEGVSGVDYAEFLTTMDQLAQRINSDEFFTNLNSTMQGVTQVTQEISTLSATLEAQVEKINVQDLDLAEFTKAAQSIQAAAVSVQKLTAELNTLLVTHQPKVNQSVDNVVKVSQDLAEISASAKALITDPALQAQIKQMVAQGAKAAENVAQASESIEKASQKAVVIADHLETLSTDLKDPGTIATLRQTLDSARSVFQNAEKITADVDEITGDPEFRKNLRNLVKGLGNLLSTQPSDPEVLPAHYQDLPRGKTQQKGSL
jgi:phospholipid/cholesterol/gamma-HCH transport system substrate-binding protein